MTEGRRRIVTGLDSEGRSTCVVDAPLIEVSETAAIAWRTAALPADNSQAADCPASPFSFDEVHKGGSCFMLVTFAPGKGQGRWHATDTIDYIVLLEGELVLMLDTGEVMLEVGDFVVDRGVNHAWRNDTDRPARAAVIMLPAHPVG